MIIRQDYHIHTSFCKHASGSMEAYVEQAIEKGFSEIGFSDHAPVQDGFDPVHRMKWDQFSTYTENIIKLRQTYKNIIIRLGVEADIYAGFETSLNELLIRFPVDYVIGSVHSIDGIPVFSKDQVVLPNHDIRKFIESYMQRLKNGIESGLIDVIGHLDVVKWNFPDWSDLITETSNILLTHARKSGVAIEINTSGIRKKPKETYPAPKLIQLAAEQGVKVVTGSDAHHPDEVGYHFETAADILIKSGYKRISQLNGCLTAFDPE